MHPYRVIQGLASKVSEFESEISNLIEAGYVPAGDLAVIAASQDFKLVQAMILDEDLEYDLDDEDDSDDEDEDE